jgi:hypothetical protein
MPSIVTSSSITVTVDGVPFTILKGDAKYAEVLRALAEDREGDLARLFIPKMVIEEWGGNGDFTVADGRVLYQGDQVPADLSSRILGMARSMGDPAPLLAFWANLSENPSWRSVEQLYTFLTHENIPITDDGYFLAYKAVTGDLKDKHTQRVDNSVGVINRMPRNRISDDPTLSCHYGFHVGALSYAQSFGGPGDILLIVKVNPRDVVCVPYDSSAQKVRVCEYEVIGVYGSPLPSTHVYNDDYLIEDGEDEGDEVEDDCSECDYECAACPCDEPQPAPTPEPTHCEMCGWLRNPEPEDTRCVPPAVTRSEQVADLPDNELEHVSIGLLRTYASQALKIFGASKIPGGKAALIERITQVRAATQKRS